MRAKYTFGLQVHSDYSPGSNYQGQGPHGLITQGQNLEVDPPRKLVQSFNALWSEDVKAEGTSQVTWEIEQLAIAGRVAPKKVSPSKVRRARCCRH